MAEKPLQLACFHRAFHWAGLTGQYVMIARRQLRMIECAAFPDRACRSDPVLGFAGCFVILRFASEWVMRSVAGGKRAATFP